MEFIIYSVFQNDQTEESNVRSHSRELGYLKSMGIPFRECLGVYKGKREYSIQVPREFGLLIKDRAWNANQECILVVFDQRSVLQYFNGDVKALGRFERVNAGYSGDHTLINGVKYAVK